MGWLGAELQLLHFVSLVEILPLLLHVPVYPMRQSFLGAGGYLPIDKQEGPEAQYSYYKQTYDAAQASLQGNTGLKGIMFWRWAGVDPTAKLADFDEAATIGARSTSPYLITRQNCRCCLSMAYVQF